MPYVPSVEALSEMISSRSRKLCDRIDWTAVSIYLSELKAGIPTLTFGNAFDADCGMAGVICASAQRFDPGSGLSGTTASRASPHTRPRQQNLGYLSLPIPGIGRSQDEEGQETSG
jgi:hypothetical protein